MLWCQHTTFAEWLPDFSHSEQRSAVWIRARFEDIELSNAVNAVRWTSNPVQLRLCEVCGHEDCDSGSYVHVARVGGTVLWTAPQLDNRSAPDPGLWTLDAVQRKGSVAMGAEEWARWHDSGAPNADVLEAANARALADAWRMSACGASRVDRLSEIVPMLKARLVGAEDYDTSAVLEHISRLVQYLTKDSHAAIDGRLERPESCGVRVAKLYFDGPPTEDWYAFALLDRVPVLALGEDCVFIPERPWPAS